MRAQESLNEIERPDVGWITHKRSYEMAKTDQKEHYSWDESGALERINGNTTLLRRLLTLYLTSSRQMLEDIDTARESQNREKLAGAAHALKGVAGNLSAPIVTSLAKELESLAASADWKVLDQSITKVREASDELATIFTRHLEAESQ